MIQIVPLTTAPNQTFEVPVQIDGTTKSLYCTLSYNELAQYWMLRVADVNGNIILDSLAFVTGASSLSGNILRQFAYLNIGSAYLFNASNIATPDFPNDNDLGTDFWLLWDDTPSTISAMLGYATPSSSDTGYIPPKTPPRGVPVRRVI